MNNSFFAFLLVLLTASCSSSTTIATKDRGVDGVYVMHAKGEFGQADDTLVVQPVKGERNLFYIERRVGYQRITENSIRPKQTKYERTVGIWDGETKQLQDQKVGYVYVLSQGGNVLLAGAAAYTRINEQ